MIRYLFILLFMSTGLTAPAVAQKSALLTSTQVKGQLVVIDPQPQFPVIGRLQSARAAIVIDADSGRILGANAVDTRRAMASTTKMMTALLVIEEINAGRMGLDDIVIVSDAAGKMGDRGAGALRGGSIMGDCGENGGACDEPIDDCPGNGQDCSVGLSSGDVVSIEDLLYGLLLDSGNDAAIALAEAVAGTEAAFVASMNERATALGMNRTHFANPHGRDPQRVDPDNCPNVVYDNSSCAHYSTARDLAKLARFAMNERLFATIVSTRTYSTKIWSAKDRGDVDPSMDNSNRMIRTDRDDNPYIYQGAMGVKTGTTDNAGFCLVSMATREAGRVIAVVLGADNNDDRYTDASVALNHGFAQLTNLDSSVISTQVPPTLDLGESGVARITLRNTGNVSWTAGDRLKLLTPGWFTQSVPLGRSVQPNRSVTVSFPLYAANPGTFTMRWQMSRNFVGRFGQATSGRPLKVIANCAQLRRALTNASQELLAAQAQLQQAIPSMKPWWSSEVRRLKGVVAGIKTQQRASGC